MSAALDMTLDDIIKNNKKSASANTRGRGRASGPGPARRLPNRAANRAAPYATAKAPESAWQHDMYADQPAAAAFAGQGGRASSIETGTKLYISNLDYGVSNDDIKELFLEVGDLKRHTVHYDRSGRSKGTAEVVFSRRADAVAAVKRYHNVQLDGKPMKVEIVGTNIATHAAAPTVNGTFGNPGGPPRSGQGRNGPLGRLRGAPRGRGGSRRGRGRGRGRDEKVSAEDLDAELEKYHAEAMQLN
ncbi:THO complex subunit 4A-like [Vigna umbellata]|uniref:THO complex subunit 4A-like n=1 Tax=Vigna umbellata TaxID=87088 RepID=UPI001F5F2D01|nr:THO complex subunit 4A-like [Vigna umbellata]